MGMRYLLLACWLTVMPGIALAGQIAPPKFEPDLIFRQIAANRGAYDRVVFFFGDSVSMMCSLENIDFSDLKGKSCNTEYMVSAMADRMRQANEPGELVHNPLWPMHSLAAACDDLFADSGLLTATDYGLHIASAKLVATYAGALGLPLPKDAAVQAKAIEKLIDDGVIRDGDVVVMEDAGYNGQNPDTYEDAWLLLGRAVLPRVKVTLVLYDMFDDIPEAPVMGIAPDAFRYDAPFPSPKSGGQRSHNQALRDAAATLAKDPDNKGTLVFLDIRRRMDAFRTALREAFGLSALTPEGIHPNIWGEAFLARELLRGADLASQITNPAPYLDRLVANASNLAPGGKSLDPAQARTFIDTWLKP